MGFNFIKEENELLSSILNGRFFNDWRLGSSTRGISIVIGNTECFNPNCYENKYLDNLKKVIKWVETNNFIIPYILINLKIDSNVDILYNNIRSTNISKYIFISECESTDDYMCISYDNDYNCCMQEDLVISISDLSLCICQGLNYPQYNYGKIIDNDIVSANIALYLKVLAKHPEGYAWCCVCENKNNCKGQILCKNLQLNGDPLILDKSVCLKRR